MLSNKNDSSFRPEQERIQELRELNIADTLPETCFDRITSIVSQVFHIPTCLISIVTEDRQWFKSCVGLPGGLENTRSTKREESFCQYVVTYCEPFIVTNALEDNRFKDLPLVQDYGVRFYAGVPLRTKTGNTLGSLCLIDYQPREWNDTNTHLLEEFSQWVVTEIELRYKNRLLDQALQKLRFLSSKDALTELYNRRELEDFLKIQWEKSAKSGAPLTIMMMDLDYFKQYNDTYGHIKGDDCLKQVAQTLRSFFTHPAQMVARYGGEEFIVVLPDTSKESAVQLAQNVIERVRALMIPHKTSKVSSVITLSIGVASEVSTSCESIGQLISRADTALYKAKQEGRNRVKVFS
ncbi:MAG TPA: sensor domain-containing diguanylate cyclase [Candidatus Bathyarchaeia archaeon]|nr:sensor domain-containing diguanylate cyclase [Candidatus Bathyarchaeia archaeon]